MLQYVAFALLCSEMFHYKKAFPPEEGTRAQFRDPPKLHFHFGTFFKCPHVFSLTTFQPDDLNLSK